MARTYVSPEQKSIDKIIPLTTMKETIRAKSIYGNLVMLLILPNDRRVEVCKYLIDGFVKLKARPEEIWFRVVANPDHFENLSETLHAKGEL